MAESPRASAPKRIFLSYGHDERTPDALRIKADLEARGHEVWFDEERLRAGRDWEAWIEDGLRQCELVLLLMTPHSVRRRDRRDPRSSDGYCLNELAKALERNKVIIPVLLVSLAPDGPPTSICRIQYLDLRDAVPIADKTAKYEDGFVRLVRAIEHDSLDFGGGQARLLRYLAPLDFDDDIRPHISRFHGRRWLFTEIEAWLDRQPTSRVFWLTGPPGIGKTAIAAYLCHYHGAVVAYHLCKAGHAEKGDPKRAVFSLAYQISQQLPEYERALQGLELEASTEQDSARVLFERLVVQPLRAVSDAGRPRIVIIDAIDEATRRGSNDIAKFIRDCWDSTPAWLRLIITSRPQEKEVLATLAHLRPYALDAKKEENLDDVRSYLQRGLAERSIAADASTIEQILARSEGVFLYIQMLLEAFDSEDLSLDRVDEFPWGLGGQYQRFFERQFPDLEEYHGGIRPMLEAVCAQREPLPVAVLRHVLGAEADLLRLLGTLGSLFPRKPQRTRLDEQTVEPCHKSIRDWLETADGPYAIDLGAGEALLADAALAWRTQRPGPAQRYLLCHGVQHLVNAGRFAQGCEALLELLRLSPLPAGVSRMTLQDAGAYLCAGISECSPDEAEALPADGLVDIAVECCGIDHAAMVPPLRVLYRHHQGQWPRLRQRLIGSGSWTAMYAASLVLADAHLNHPSGDVLDDITSLIDSADMREQELGLYALKLMRSDDPAVLRAARRTAASDAFIVRAVLNELLLTLALDGADACELIEDAGLWQTWWPYLRTQLDDIAAVQEIVRGRPTPYSTEPAVARAREELATTLRARDELLTGLATEPELRELLHGYTRLPRMIGDLPEAAGPIRRSRLAERALLLLFAHPAWEVRAGAAKLAATVAGSRPDIVRLVEDCLDHADYRVRYAALEAAYHMRHRDNAALLEHALRRGAGDEEAWVRGIAADCLYEWMAQEGTPCYERRVRQFRREIARFLNDTDMWPLEVMVTLARALHNEGMDMLSLVETQVRGLLAEIPEWHTLDRAELQPRLDALVRRPGGGPRRL